MASLKELQAQRAKLDAEIKEREQDLTLLSMQNIRQDLDDVIAPSDSIVKVAQVAARCGLALTTTKDHDADDRLVLEGLVNKYGAHTTNSIAALAARIVEKMGQAEQHAGGINLGGDK